MTQQPFSRPGAIDLSALKRPASPPPAAPTAGGATDAGSGNLSPYAVAISEQNFQATIEASMTAPVVLVFYSRTRMPESGQLADDLETLSTEFDGRFAPLLQDALPLEELRTALTQVMQQLTAQGITGRHQPRTAAPAEAAEEGEEAQVDPRYAAAQEALG